MVDNLYKFYFIDASYNCNTMEKQKQELSQDEIIKLMRVTKKADPLFKVIKKVKTALEAIGRENLSRDPTRRVIVFHFGLGNSLDMQFVNISLSGESSSSSPHGGERALQVLNYDNVIIAGHSYCFLEFTSPQSSEDYLHLGNKHVFLEPYAIYYSDLQYQNLSRVLVYFYCKDNAFKQDEVIPVLNNCQSLYSQDQNIPGLSIIQQVISKEEEEELLGWIDQHKWEKLNNRRVQHYGYDFKYGKNLIDKEEHKGQLPEQLHPLLHRIISRPQIKPFISHFDQLTINDYFAGDGIPPHFDTHSPFQTPFVSLSILSGIVMDFRRFDGKERSVYLKERSLAIFSGEARFAWIHGIACRKMDKVDRKVVHRNRRLSLTFRKIRMSPCECPYYFYCDSQGYNQETMKKNNPLLTKYLSNAQKQQLMELQPSEIQKEYVEKAYNGFGFDFHNKVIEEVKGYLETDCVKGQTEFILDIGCGNGEYKNYIPSDSVYIGVEKCITMIPVEEQLHMDARRLCLKSDAFDRVLFIAVLHHLASQSTRLECLREACRVLKSGGVLYLSVLHYSQSKMEIYSSPQTILQYCLSHHRLEEKEQLMKEKHSLYHQFLQVQNPRVEQKGQVYKRYYHLFIKAQIMGLISQIPNLSVADYVENKENIILKVIKK